MKIAYNESLKTVILADGRLKLHPKGSRDGKDRRQIQDHVAERPDVLRFVAKGLITIRTLPEAATYDKAVAQALADSKAVTAAKAAVRAEKLADAAQAAADAIVVPKPAEPVGESPAAPAAEPVAAPVAEPVHAPESEPKTVEIAVPTPTATEDLPEKEESADVENTASTGSRRKGKHR